MVRDANGNILDPAITGVIELYRRVCFKGFLQELEIMWYNVVMSWTFNAVNSLVV